MSADAATLEDRIARLRTTVMRELNEVFNELVDMADSESMGGLVTLAARYERERDEARARISELESELQRRPAPGSKAQHQALIEDAARTMRNAMKGITEMPMTDVGGARVIGQVNKAVVAFDKTMLGIL